MTTTEQAAYPNTHLITDTSWLEPNLSSSQLTVLDTRAKGYEEGHIPGAIHVNIKLLKDSANATIAAADAVKAVLEDTGIGPESTVVVYDEGGSVLAARLFYVLEFYGLKDQVKVLNGGFAAWQAEGREVSTATPSVSPSERALELRPDPQRITTKQQIQAGLKASILLDTRSAEEYRGEDLRSNRKGGHIASAVHKEWKEALVPADAPGISYFKSYSELKREYEEAGVTEGSTIVPYCQSNQRGAHTYFVLRLLGYVDIRPYEGSWDEWGNAEDTDVVK